MELLMPKISLTTFIDFVHKSGPPRLTCVRQAKRQYESTDGFQDYWRLLREQIVRVHKENLNLSELDEVLLHVKKADRKRNYSLCIANYKKLFGKKNIAWEGTTKALWEHEDLTVSVNPELCLNINSSKYIIKLYFKSDNRLSKQKLDVIYYLMDKTKSKNKISYTSAVVDLQNGKFLPQTTPVQNVEILLKGEATSFLAMWNSL